MNNIRHFIEDEEGAITIEYALLAALIGLAIIVGAGFLGGQLCGIMQSIGSAIAGASPTNFSYSFAQCS